MEAPELVFQDPPPSRRNRVGSAHWDAIAAALQANPGQWALITEVEHKKMSGIAQTLKGRGLETTTRKVSDTHSQVYARAAA